MATVISAIEIESALVDMPDGHCGVKFDCLVWRICEDCYSVGQSSVCLYERMDLAAAVGLIQKIRATLGR